jgi:hypothetical protein
MVVGSWGFVKYITPVNVRKVTKDSAEKLTKCQGLTYFSNNVRLNVGEV